MESINIIPCGHMPSKDNGESPLVETVEILQSQLKFYISDQRSRDALSLSDRSDTSDEVSLAESGHSTASPQPTPATDTASLSDPLRREDITLQEIFDTPECRTQVSPSRSAFCQLRRRQATIYRSSKLSKSGVVTTVSQLTSPEDSRLSFANEEELAIYEPQTLSEEQMCESPTDLTSSQEPTTVEGGRLSAIASKMPLVAIKKFMGFEASAAKVPLLQIPDPTSRSLCAPSASNLKPSLSQRRRREPLTIEKCKTLPLPISTPMTADSPGSMLTDADTIATTLSSPATSPSPSRPQSLSSASQTNVTTKAQQTSRRWSARPAMESVVRNLTPPPTQRTFNAEYIRSSSPARAIASKTEQLTTRFRKMEVEEICDVSTVRSSFDDLESKSKRKSRRRSAPNDKQDNRQRSASASATLRNLVTPSQKRRNKSVSPQRNPSPPLESRPGSSASIVSTLPTILESSRFTSTLSPIVSPISPTRQSSLHASYGIIHGPIRLNRTPSSTHIFSPVSPEDVDPHLPSSILTSDAPPQMTASPSTLSASSPSSSAPPSSSSSNTSPAADTTTPFDLSIFQLAISGPTGDFLQHGFGALPSPAHPGATNTGTGTSGDDTLSAELDEWFAEYGFDHEGRWVDGHAYGSSTTTSTTRGNNKLPGGGEMASYEWACIPGAQPGEPEQWAWRLTTNTATTSSVEGKAAGMPPRIAPYYQQQKRRAANHGSRGNSGSSARSGRSEGEMSANLNDPCDFLGFDVAPHTAWEF